MAGPVPGALGIVEENDVRVPMRDGITLSSDVLRPDAPGAFPGLLLRSPYGRRAIAYADFERLVRNGYVVVLPLSTGPAHHRGVALVGRSHQLAATPSDGNDNDLYFADGDLT